MPAIQFPRVASGMSTEQLADLVARCLKEVEWLANGNMDSRNIRNIAGYNVGPNELKHSSGIVGMNGADPTNPNAIRFWSGNADPTIASFRVTQAGILTAVGMVLQSGSTGDRVVMDSTGLHTYDASGVERLTIGTTTAKGVKAITGRDTSGVAQSVTTYDTETVDGASRTGQYITAHGAYMLIENTREIRMQTGVSTVDTGFRAKTLGRPEINDGGGWSPIAKQGVSTSSAGFHNHGITGGVKLATTSDGVTIDGYVTWVEGGSHSHTQN